jgi:hypothetical protein
VREETLLQPHTAVLGTYLSNGEALKIVLMTQNKFEWLLTQSINHAGLACVCLAGNNVLENVQGNDSQPFTPDIFDHRHFGTFLSKK